VESLVRDATGLGRLRHAEDVRLQETMMSGDGKASAKAVLTDAALSRQARLPDISIPFNRSSLMGNELKHIVDSVNNGQIAGDQMFSRKCQALLEQTLGAIKALVTTSCTHALEMCGLLLEVGPNDEVIVPSFSFVSTANAFSLRGARIVFAIFVPTH
jgi:hypothetical protein